MRHLFAVVVCATVAALSLLSCGSDSDDSSAKAGSANGGGGGSGGGAAPSQCVGSNAEFTPAEFLAQTEPDKACSDESDVTTVCENNLPLIGGACGKSCLGMGNDAQQAVCVADCIQAALAKSGSQPLSADCMACATADIECARKNCILDCATDPGSEKCGTCRVENGCVEAFYSCSGFPQPGAGGGSGGEGGS